MMRKELWTPEQEAFLTSKQEYDDLSIAMAIYNKFGPKRTREAIKKKRERMQIPASDMKIDWEADKKWKAFCKKDSDKYISQKWSDEEKQYLAACVGKDYKWLIAEWQRKFSKTRSADSFRGRLITQELPLPIEIKKQSVNKGFSLL